MKVTLLIWTLLMGSTMAWGTPSHIVMLKPKMQRSPLPAHRVARYKFVRKMMDTRFHQELKPFVQTLGVTRSTQVTYLPIINGVAMNLTQEQVKALKANPQVYKVVANSQVHIDNLKPVVELPRRQRNTTLNEGLILHQVDQLILEGVDLHKPGKVVGIIDTGIDGTHPELKDKIYAFKAFPEVPGTTAPFDHDEHGTHVAGIVAGGNLSGVQLGVYPGAKLAIAANSMTSATILHAVSAFQWMMDPDGNPDTQDQAFVINNSWGWQKQHNIDPTPFYAAFKTLHEADILVLFAAGNSASQGMGFPSNYPSTFTTAATEKDGRIASFSSWGPQVYDGQTLNKPEVASFGVKVMSTLPRGKYGRMSGTSMASPFTTGAVALLGAHFPNLSPYTIANALVETAHQVSRSSWNRQSGNGVINLHAAYLLLKNKHAPVVPFL